MICAFYTYGQGYDNNWCFGGFAKIKFVGNNPVDDGHSPFDVLEGSSSISDYAGNLLFSTDGVAIYDKNGAVMPNGNSLHGHFSSTQNVLIVPFPGDSLERFYYVFTVAANNDWDHVHTGLEYVVVDMQLNNGLGAVIGPSKELLAMADEKLHATWHANQKDVWVVAHRSETNKFYAYLINCQGIQDPVVSATGKVQNHYLNGTNTMGALKLSPDGSRIALTFSQEGPIITNFRTYLEIGTFDNSTGAIKINELIERASLDASPGYGVEFSPDNSKLYWTLKENFSYILQYDFNAPNFLASETMIISPTPYLYGAIQLAPNGKLYIANMSGFQYLPSLSSIENPNVAGTGCNLVNQSVNLTGQSSLGLPNQWMYPYPVYRKPIDTTFTAYCPDYDVQITAPGEPPYLWSTGATDKNIFVEDTGTYWVRAVNGCEFDTTMFVVGEHEECFCTLYVPNAFTPDGDGVNDGFGAIMQDECEMVEFSMLIFNRWGELIYEFGDISDRWMGDQIEKSDMFLWKAQYVVAKGSSIFHRESSGHVMVVR